MILMRVNEGEKKAAVLYTADKIGEEILEIGPSDLDRVIIGFSKNEDMRRKVNIPPLYQMPELLVFVGFDSDKLDAFLDTYKSTGARPVALKAISTVFNSVWTLFELIEHLKEEQAGR